VVAKCIALGTPDMPSRLRHGLDSPVMLATCAWYAVSDDKVRVCACSRDLTGEVQRGARWKGATLKMGATL